MAIGYICGFVVKNMINILLMMNHIRTPFLKIQYFRKVIVIFSVETAEVASSAMAEVLSTLCIFISDC